MFVCMFVLTKNCMLIFFFLCVVGEGRNQEEGRKEGEGCNSAQTGSSPPHPPPLPLTHSHTYRIFPPSPPSLPLPASSFPPTSLTRADLSPSLPPSSPSLLPPQAYQPQPHPSIHPSSSSPHSPACFLIPHCLLTLIPSSASFLILLFAVPSPSLPSPPVFFLFCYFLLTSLTSLASPVLSPFLLCLSSSPISLPFTSLCCPSNYIYLLFFLLPCSPARPPASPRLTSPPGSVGQRPGTC